MPRFDLYQSVTDKILEALEAGVAPWRNPLIKQPSTLPISLATGRPYRGINIFLLAMRPWAEGYPSGYWLTYRQCQAVGGQVKPGEKSSIVVFWKLIKRDEPERDIPVLRYFRVFNAAQCQGLPDNLIPTPAPGSSLGNVPGDNPREAFVPIDAAARILDGYPPAWAIRVVGPQPCYRPLHDQLMMPEPERFVSDEAWYGTYFHELIHATGHSSRLDRGLDVKLSPFGSADYGKEELIAEMGAAFLCAHAGIEPVTLENSAAYLDGWIKTIKASPKLVIHAAGAAQRAADLILGAESD
jgi:antirestriction protein ArdC